MSTEGTPPAGDHQGRQRPDLLMKLVLPVAVAVVIAILVAALTPVGDNLRELFFPTKADVSGSVTVDGQPAAGAQLTLDNEGAGNTDDQRRFVIDDVGDGHHTLLVVATGAKPQTYEFTVQRGETRFPLPETIELAPLFRLGYYVGMSSDLSSSTLTYDMTLWIQADPRAMDQIESVTYTLPIPLSGTATGRSAAQAFCYRQTQTLDFEEFVSAGGGFRTAGADVDLVEGGTVQIFAPSPGDQQPQPCVATHKQGSGGGNAGGGTGDGTGGGGPPPPPDVVVPSVVGLPVAVAKSILEAARLRWKVSNVSSDEAEGTVVKQSPAPGTEVNERTIIQIRVSSGSLHDVPIPLVIGLTYEQAAEQLQRAGFHMSRQDVESDRETGIVVDQDPSAGTNASPGSTVLVSVSKGSSSTTSVPDVTGLDISAARAKLEEAGFRTRIVFDSTDDSAQDGVVLSQDPQGGTQAKLGSLVTLVVGRFVEQG
jgi:hypothetical protein